MGQDRTEEIGVGFIALKSIWQGNLKEINGVFPPSLIEK